MSKFNSTRLRAAVHSPVTSEISPSGRTFEGGRGYARDTRSEAFLLGVSSLFGEDTFYESAADRDARFVQLIRELAAEDPEWTARFLRWLRSEANLRTVSLVGAAEFVKARLDARSDDGLVSNKAVIASVMLRADEPGELLAYWMSRYGRAIPKPVKRGLAEVMRRLYDERALLKYDSSERGVRFGDVIDLVHPRAGSEWRDDLYRHALDRRHNRSNATPTTLATLRKREELMSTPVGARATLLRSWGDAASQHLRAAGMTWEALAGWLQSPMDAVAWEAISPVMGYMALLRNLRNFDEAGLSDKAAKVVADRLADPHAVARSRQLPFRFMTAYLTAPSDRWRWPLDQALNHCLFNVPKLAGRTLILVDTSGSMDMPFSENGMLKRWDAAVLFGLAVAHRCEHVDVVSFSNSTRVFPLRAGGTLLHAIDRWRHGGWMFGGGTYTAAAVRAHFAGHDRVVILTDEQATDGDVDQAVPAHVPLYTWNLAGYKRGHGPSGSGTRHTFGGLTDHSFRMIPLLEAGRNAEWPF